MEELTKSIQLLAQSIDHLAHILERVEHVSGVDVKSKTDLKDLPEWLEIYSVSPRDDVLASELCKDVKSYRQEKGLAPWSSHRIYFELEKMGFHRVKIKGVRYVRGLKDSAFSL